MKSEAPKDKKFSIYIGNIPKNVTSEELKKHFETFYPSITNSKIIFDQYTKISKGYGFIDFSSSQEYQKALNSNHSHILSGHQLVIKPAKGKQEEEIQAKESKEEILSESSMSLPQTETSSNQSNTVQEKKIKSFLGEDSDNKPVEKEREFSNELEIRNGLKSVLYLAQLQNVKSKQCDYYCNMYLYKNEVSFFNNKHSNGYVNNMPVYNYHNYIRDCQNVYYNFQYK